MTVRIDNRPIDRSLIWTNYVPQFPCRQCNRPSTTPLATMCDPCFDKLREYVRLNCPLYVHRQSGRTLRNLQALWFDNSTIMFMKSFDEAEQLKRMYRMVANRIYSYVEAIPEHRGDMRPALVDHRLSWVPGLRHELSNVVTPDEVFRLGI